MPLATLAVVHVWMRGYCIIIFVLVLLAFLLMCNRLLDQGFEKDVLAIVQKLNDARVKSDVHRCNVLLSATLSDSVQRLADVSLHNPRVVDCGDSAVPLQLQAAAVSGDSALSGSQQLGKADYTTARGLTQYFAILPCKLRLIALAAFLRWKSSTVKENKIVAFVSSRDAVKFYQQLFSLPYNVRTQDFQCLAS